MIESRLAASAIPAGGMLRLASHALSALPRPSDSAARDSTGRSGTRRGRVLQPTPWGFS